MAYTCDNSEFVFFNKNNKTVASGIVIDCKTLNDRKSLMTTNISSDLANIGIPAGLVVNKDLNKSSNLPNYLMSKQEIVDDDMYSSLLKLLSKKQQMHHNIKTKSNKKCLKNKTAKKKITKKTKK